MTEPTQPLSVRLVRAGDPVETEGVVQDPTERPWTVLEVDADKREPAAPQNWQVIIYVSLESNGESELIPHVFESREVAKRWIELHGLTGQFTWHFVPDPDAPDVPDGFADEFARIAAQHDVEVDSSEAFHLAREDDEFGKRFSSLTFYPEISMLRNASTPPLPIPTGQLYELPWIPRSCRHAGSSELYSYDGQLNLSLSVAELDLSTLPFDVAYAYTV
jgi:hypothetical protein